MSCFDNVDVEIIVLDPKCKPEYETPGAAGMDLKARLDNEIEIAPDQRVCIPTGIKVAIPLNYAMYITPRGGTSLKTSLRVSNSPGLVDPDFRGEVQVIVHNTNQAGSLTIKPYDRIAQFSILPMPRVNLVEVNELSSTKRGEGMLGSTGTNG